MEIVTLILIAIGLSFDTFAVSVSSGLLRKEIIFWQAVRIALILAMVQAIMPIIGWLCGLSVRNLIAPIDHWIALGLLSTLGLKMIIESFRKDSDKSIDPMESKIIFGMAIATSIDALAVGVSFAMIDVNMLAAVLIIGTVTFLASMLGILFGKKTGHLLGRRMEIIGGLILIIIGVKILVEDLYF